MTGRQLNATADVDIYDGIPKTLYVAFGTDFVEVTSDLERAREWPYITREFEHVGKLGAGADD